tara:strand:+ start:2812 stop:3060 length:249 start_codon:yes stop_codon:yes gene_type:complete
MEQPKMLCRVVIDDHGNDRLTTIEVRVNHETWNSICEQGTTRTTTRIDRLTFLLSRALMNMDVTQPAGHRGVEVEHVESNFI